MIMKQVKNNHYGNLYLYRATTQSKNDDQRKKSMKEFPNFEAISWRLPAEKNQSSVSQDVNCGSMWMGTAIL